MLSGPSAVITTSTLLLTLLFLAVRLFVNGSSEANPYPPVTSQIVDYILELDHRGDIIGGEWISNARPGFFWNPANYTKKVPYFQRILDIYEKARAKNNRPYSLEGFIQERY